MFSIFLLYRRLCLVPFCAEVLTLSKFLLFVRYLYLSHLGWMMHWSHLCQSYDFRYHISYHHKEMREEKKDALKIYYFS